MNHPHMNHPPGSCSSTTLYKFICLDIDDKTGCCLLVPFLTTNDLLRLSECSKTLKNYRYYLSRIKIISRDKRGRCIMRSRPTEKRNLCHLLSEQRLAINVLCLADTRVVKVIDEMGWSCCQAVEALDLSGVKGQFVDCASLARGLLGGNLLQLQELILKGFICSVDSLERLMSALAEGACPHLRLLDLSNHSFEGGNAGEAIALALGSNNCRDLECLMMDGWLDHAMGQLPPIMRAIQRSKCPQLRELGLAGTLLSGQDTQALADTIGSGSLPCLETLELMWDSDEGDSVVAVMESLRTGVCANLRVLALNSALGRQGGEAVARALSSGQRHYLQELCLTELPMDDHVGGGQGILLAIKQGACPNLLKLTLSYCGRMGQQFCRFLFAAIQCGALTKLESLGLPSCPLGDAGIGQIAEALATGGCRQLQHLDLSDTAMEFRGAHSLAHALASGSISHLKTCDIHETRVGDRAMAMIIEALAARCPNLESLGAENTGMSRGAGEALCEAWSKGVFRSLRSVVISRNVEIGDAIVGRRLAEILKGGGGARLEVLDIGGCGMEREGAWKLAGVLASGVCPRLERLRVDGAWKTTFGALGKLSTRLKKIESL